MKTMTTGSAAKATLALVLALLLASTPSAAQHRQAEDDSPRSFSIHAGLDYMYGDWDQGDLDLDPRLGMVGLNLQTWFLGEKFGAGVRYVSGDFEGEEAVLLEDPGALGDSQAFGSYKQMSMGESREDLELSAFYRVANFAVVELGYKYLDYQLGIDLDLVSSIRTYGSGNESYRSEARGLSIGAALELPLVKTWSLDLEGSFYPSLDTDVQGSYNYFLPEQERSVNEQWTYNGEAAGFSGEAALQFTLPKEPITLRLGYYYQKIESQDDVAPTWVDDDLGQGPRDWLNDESQGLTFGAEFRF